MSKFNRKPHHEKEMDALKKKEQNFFKRHITKQESAFNRFLAEKIPAKLQQTLDHAFEKAFALIFEKGTGIIEKTYKKDEMEKEYLINRYANEIHQSRKSLKTFSKKAVQKSGANLVLSGLMGIGMGAAGIGIPDIPIFTGTLLKCIYETALNFGYEYHTEEEKYFILLVIEGAVSYGGHFEDIDKKVDAFIKFGQLPKDYQQSEQIKYASAALSKELLYMKFLQGLPIVGAVGGAYDAVYMKQVSEYARLKYYKRFLMKIKQEQNHDIDQYPAL